MKSRGVNRVDLSLDDIVKMDGLDKSKGTQRNKGQGQKGQGQKGQGFCPPGPQQGPTPGTSGVSPLNRDKPQRAGVNIMANNNRGQQTMSRGGGGQSGRGQGRPWSMNRGGQWGAKVGGGGGRKNITNSNNSMRNNNNLRNNNMRRPANSSSGPLITRGHQGKQQQQQLQQRHNNLYGDGLLPTPVVPVHTARQQIMRQGQGSNMQQGGFISKHRQSALSHQGHKGPQGHKGVMMGQGNFRVRVMQQQQQTQNGIARTQPVGLKERGFDAKRQMAMQALREARKTIAQLDQQAARQSLVNTRRGIASSPSLSYQNQGDGCYGNSISLDSDSEQSSSDSECGVGPGGPQLMSFNIAPSGARVKAHKRWQHKPPLAAGDPKARESTLTIRIDNSAPFVSHRESPMEQCQEDSELSLFSPRSNNSNCSLILPPPEYQNAQSWRVPQKRVRDKPSHHNRPHTHPHPHPHHKQQQQASPHTSPPPPLPPRYGQSQGRHQHPYQQTASAVQHRHNQWQPSHSPSTPPPPPHFPAEQGMVVAVGGGGDAEETRRGASASFSRQLAQLKPTVAVKYQFQSKTFAAASTPVSLNDRFSVPASEERKVFS